ncbi:hypothetical protein [Gordonia polyisoprenivorans]|uniref:hypothetical protein n=1 Tax=Gordonia polyisoprenivorans TaxID=84595 RepID=UPI001AD626BE|nr:hypothetical protein [Gordonia polyisoprenivorans]QTI70909.1 hypothetical protein J6U32_10495 [Gordonia polyisoprenivorans]
MRWQPGQTLGVNEVVVNGAEWEVTTRNGDLAISSILSRRESVTNAPTGIWGQVLELGTVTRVRL